MLLPASLWVSKAPSWDWCLWHGPAPSESFFPRHLKTHETRAVCCFILYMSLASGQNRDPFVTIWSISDVFPPPHTNAFEHSTHGCLHTNKSKWLKMSCGLRRCNVVYGIWGEGAGAGGCLMKSEQLRYKYILKNGYNVILTSASQ